MSDTRRDHSRNGFLTERGYELAQQISLEGLTPVGDSVRVDIPVSVSGERRDETFLIFDEELIDEQYRRFLSVPEEGPPSSSGQEIY